jgi:hypothetical protein
MATYIIGDIHGRARSGKSKAIHLRENNRDRLCRFRSTPGDSARRNQQRTVEIRLIQFVAGSHAASFLYVVRNRNQ